MKITKRADQCPLVALRVISLQSSFGRFPRWHQTLKNRILLDNYYLPGDLERQIGAFVEHYNNVRYHESIDNLTPADVYFGRAEMILTERQRIKRQTIANRRLQHRLQAA
jgi:putative transposase